MTTTTIAQIHTFPNGTPIEAVEGKLVAVYEYRPQPNGKFGPTTVQNAELADVAGNRLRLSVWGHPDLSVLKGDNLILQASKGKGVEVKHGSYNKANGETVKTVELTVGKAGTFQRVGGPSQPNVGVSSPTTAPDTQNQQKSANDQKRGIYGATVGMAINVAVDLMKHDGDVATGAEDFEIRLQSAASKIIRVAQKLEAGELL